MRGNTLKLDRRALLEKAAVISSAAALASAAKTVAKASPAAQQDTMIRELWGKWLIELAADSEANRTYEDAIDRSQADRVPVPWEVSGVCENKAVPGCDVVVPRFSLMQKRVVAGNDGAVIEERGAPVEADSVSDAFEIGHAQAAADRDAFDKAEARRYRKHRLAELDEAAQAAYERQIATAEAIADTPAEGVFGLAAKLVVAAMPDIRDRSADSINTVRDWARWRACNDACAMAGEDLRDQAAIALGEPAA